MFRVQNILLVSILFLSVHSVRAADPKLEEIRFENRLLAFELFRLKSSIEDYGEKIEEEEDEKGLFMKSLESSGGLLLMSGGFLAQSVGYIGLVGLLADLIDDHKLHHWTRVGTWWKDPLFWKLYGVSFLLIGGGALAFDGGSQSLSAKEEWGSTRVGMGLAMTLAGYATVRVGSAVAFVPMDPLGAARAWPEGVWRAAENKIGHRSANGVRLTAAVAASAAGSYLIWQGISNVAQREDHQLSIGSLLSDASVEDPRARKTARFFGVENSPGRVAVLKEKFANGEMDAQGLKALEDFEDPMGESLIPEDRLAAYAEFQERVVEVDRNASKQPKEKLPKGEKGKEIAAEYHEFLSGLLVAASKRLDITPEDRRRIRSRVRESKTKVSKAAD